jgi:hypothetical protein
MEIPLKVLNRLRLGRTVAAEIAATISEHRAWVHVRPLIASEKGYRDGTDFWKEPKATSYNVAQNPIAGFCVRRIEVPAELVVKARADEWDLTSQDCSVDEGIVANSEEELARILSQWIPDGAALRIPYDAGYPLY